MQENGSHPSVIFSRNAIVRSLLDLMERKCYSDITIQMIADNAGVARRTVYRHFASKEGILQFYADGLQREYIEMLSSGENVESTVLVYFSFWMRHLDFLKLIYKNKLMMTVLERLEEALERITSVVRSEDFADCSRNYLGYYQAYHAGGYWRLLCQWLEGGARETPEEMSAMYRRIIRSTYGRLRSIEEPNT